MTKIFLDITLSFFLIICAIALIFLAINGKKVSTYYSTAFEIQKNTVIELQNTFNNTLLKHFSILENQAQAQKNFYEKSIIINTVIFEAGIALGAGVLEKEGALSYTDSNKIIDQSIDNIKVYSERLGILLKASNDIFRNQNYAKKLSESQELKPVPNQRSVNGRFVTNSTAGTLFVITGRAENPSNIPYSHIQIKGTLVTKDKTEAKTRLVYCGNIIPEQMLKIGTMSEINKRLMVKEGKNNTNISLPPGASIPFMVVFSDLPEKLQNFTVKVTAFKKSNHK